MILFAFIGLITDPHLNDLDGSGNICMPGLHNLANVAG